MPTNNYSDNSFDDQAPLDDEQLWDLLSLYVDGEADPEQAAIVEQMLSSDPAYRRDFDFLMASSKTMHMLEEVEPPASLRETVLAKTSHRPTLVGRLRAAWNRTATPASPTFGRYATAGGAFAVVAIGAMIFWPHHNSTSGTGTLRTPVAITDTPRTTVAENTTLPHTIAPPLFTFPPIKPDRGIAPRPPFHPREIVPPSPQLAAEAKALKATKETKKQIATGMKPAPHNYSLPNNNAPHPQVVLNPPIPGGYDYSKHMDEGVARHEQRTIDAASGNELGTKLVAYDEPTTPTPRMPDNDPPKQPTTVVEGGSVTPAPAPKSRIRVAVLPPAAQQVLQEAALRKNPPPRLDNFDHSSIADSGQRHEVFTLLKSPL